MDPQPVHAWQLLHPPLQCHRQGWLDVADGHQIYFEESGHPGAPAALFIHGGPGAGCTPHDRRWFNPQRWRIVLFDQRGAGRSRAVAALHANTTAHLVGDIEKLRQHLNVSQWLLFGGSWGATLALAYAQAHPQRVQGLVLRGVFIATRAEAGWLYGRRGAAACHPAAWQSLCAAAGVENGMALLDAMHQRLLAGDAQSISAAQAWWRWEQDLMDAETTGPRAPQQLPADNAALLGAARIGVHYARHAWFLSEGQLLAHAQRLQGLPGVIVQGTRDLVTPLATAQALHGAWRGASWHAVAAAGHASSHPGVARLLVNAIDTFAWRLETASSA